MLEKFRRGIARERAFPIILFSLLALAFGTLVWGLGFYQDDWPHLYYGRILGLSQVLDLYRYTTRPPGTLLYVTGFAALGYTPLYWQILSLAMRFFTCLFLWLTLRSLWTQHKRFAAWTTLLFAVYPLFRLQPLAVTYFYHWSGYLLFLISLWAMIQSLRQPRRFWLYYALSLVTCLAHMFLMEYFLGLELIRPLILWLLLAEKPGHSGARLKRLLSLWAPYLLGLMAFILYRIFIIPGVEPGPEKIRPVLLYEFGARPLSALLHLLQAVLQDSIYSLATTWSQVISPNLFAINRPVNLLALLLGGALGVGIYLYLVQVNRWESSEESADRRWIWSVLLVGLAFTLCGLMPSWVTGRSVSQEGTIWSQRFGLAAMIGGSMVTVGMLELLIRNLKHRMLLFTILLVFCASASIQLNNDFRWSWTKQQRFFNQLYWRAPYIHEGTALLSDEEVFPYMGDYPVSFALGMLYPKADTSKNMAYWFYSVSTDFFEDRQRLVEGIPLVNGRYLNVFTGDSRESLVIYYAPEKNQCLWVLRPQDAQIRILPKILQDIAPASNLSRIEQAPPRPYPFPADVFGKEIQPTWCYYFQKADLARQFQEWERIGQLWDEAGAAGFQPQNGVEYLPFIEGFARQNDWQQAARLSMQANRISEAMPKILCPTWDQIAAEMQPSPDQQATLDELRLKLRCEQ